MPLHQYHAAKHYWMPLLLSVDKLGEQKLRMSAPWMFLNQLNFHQIEIPHYVSSFHQSWMAVFTLDEDYSLCSPDICLPDTFYDNIKNVFLFFLIIAASIANQNIWNTELHELQWSKPFQLLSWIHVNQLTKCPLKI